MDDMTTKEAIQVLIWCDKKPDYRCTAAMIRDAQEVLVSALRVQQTPAKLDRSRWDGCEVCLTIGAPENWEDGIKFCPRCGIPLTEEAWAELERRINSGAVDRTI